MGGEGVVTVFVDAENVRRSRWPNVTREELVGLCRDWAEAERCRVVVVFDGRPPEVDPGPGCELVGSNGGSADDTIVREAQARARLGPVWVATSDRGLRARLVGVQRLVGGGSFLAELLRQG